MAGYTLSEIAARLGLSRSVISGLIAAGFVTPARGARREYRFSFQDMVLLRAAQGLQAAQIPPRRIVQSLRQLRQRLPEEVPLAGLRIGALGREVVVREGGQPWRADSGQLLFDFDATFSGAGATAEVRDLRAAARAAPKAATHAASNLLPNAAPKMPPHVALGLSAERAAESLPERASKSEAKAGPRRNARGAGAAAGRPGLRPGHEASETGTDAHDGADWFQRGAELEASDPARAEAAYRRAIALQPTRADAYLNLGALLAELGRHDAAIATYREGLVRCPQEALLHYNLAVALEDVKRTDAAIAAYDRCLALDPAMADAHFNVARLHDQLGRAKHAIRHYSAYRRLRAGKG